MRRVFGIRLADTSPETAKAATRNVRVLEVN